MTFMQLLRAIKFCPAGGRGDVNRMMNKTTRQKLLEHHQPPTSQKKKDFLISPLRP
jgi:hypothetical protein